MTVTAWVTTGLRTSRKAAGGGWRKGSGSVWEAASRTVRLRGEAEEDGVPIGIYGPSTEGSLLPDPLESAGFCGHAAGVGDAQEPQAEGSFSMCLTRE